MSTTDTGSADAASPDTRMTGRQKVILLVLLTASFTLAVDFSVLNVALPVIGSEVGFSLESLQWVATSFALCAAGFTLLFGRIADLFGRRRLFLGGMLLLGVSSMVGGLAGTPAVLLAARVAQGVATAVVAPSALSLITTSFAEGRLRERALGVNGALMAAGFTTGAILGGLLADLLSWRWAFFINVPVAVFVLVLGPVVLRESRPSQRPRLDVSGALTVTLGLLAVVYGLTTAGERSWTDPTALVSLAVGAVLLVVFWLIEQRVDEPLIPVTILRRRSIAWGNVSGMLAFATETSLVFLLTLYLQEVLGYSPMAAGLSFAVLGLGTVLGGVVGPKVIGRVGYRNTIVTGFVVQAGATLPLVLLGPSGGWLALLLVATFVGGVANLVAIVGFMVAGTSGLGDHEQGLATGLTTMSQQVGITMGIPIMSAIVAARVNALGAETPSTLLTAIGTAIVVNAALCVVTAVLVVAFLRPSTSAEGRAAEGVAESATA